MKKVYALDIQLLHLSVLLKHQFKVLRSFEKAIEAKPAVVVAVPVLHVGSDVVIQQIHL